ncbi:MAG: O-antigen ligase family protein [Anaerolineales bacterium]|nr:O-antigen ligase family protein [Anaerolineales bacterium]MCX7754340.1 O-antigen ligase family protein [Anaerolineales bacterium]MDW8279057.1 O-antigen ligase family protein [Anaerolineales bacterium]
MSRLTRLLWALTLVSLPVTSFRYMPFMGAGTFVRPLALYPLALLLVILLIRLWRREVSFPRLQHFTVLGAFVLAAIASTAFGAVFAPIELRGVDYADRAIRAFVTLAIGLAFFLAAVWMNQEEQDIRFSIRWLMVGLAAHIVWSAVQLYGLNYGYRAELREIQEWFSVRGLVRNRRVSGFAFEPSWLAGQLAVLYLPWLIARLLTAEYDHWKDRALSERMKLAAVVLLSFGALGTLLATYSRTGLVMVAAAIVVTVLIAGQDKLHAFGRWFRAGFRQSAAGRLRAAAVRVGLILLLLAALTGASLFLASRNYISSLWSTDLSDIWRYLSNASMGPRFGYILGAMAAFNVNPLTGVGLGASGFWIYQNLPDALLMGEPEIAEALSPSSWLFPNPKNFYIRLLAETGLVGLALFLAFWLGILADGLAAVRQPQPFLRFLGAACIFTLTALAFYVFSVDSFAMPELWVNLGMLAGVFSAASHQNAAGFCNRSATFV